jgi:hypothetical protein
MVGFGEHGTLKIENSLTFQKIIRTIEFALKYNFL